MLFYEEDRELLLISRYRERLGRHFRFVVPDPVLVEDLVDKGRFQALARRLDLPVPPARVLNPSMDPVPLDLEFPVALKPIVRRGDRWTPVGGAAKALRLDTLVSLASYWPRLAAAGIPVCVASQGKLSKTRLSLTLTGLDRLFPEDSRFSAYSVANGKPAPDLFLYAASAMGAEAAGCVVVEDTPSGVRAAVSAGMRALGYAADSDERALRAAGAEVFHALEQLPGLIGLGAGR